MDPPASFESTDVADQLVGRVGIPQFAGSSYPAAFSSCLLADHYKRNKSLISNAVWT